MLRNSSITRIYIQCYLLNVHAVLPNTIYFELLLFMGWQCNFSLSRKNNQPHTSSLWFNNITLFTHPKAVFFPPTPEKTAISKPESHFVPQMNHSPLRAGGTAISHQFKKTKQGWEAAREKKTQPCGQVGVSQQKIKHLSFAREKKDKLSSSLNQVFPVNKHKSGIV